MPPKWPAKTVFRDVVLEVEDRTCPKCGSPRSAKSARVRRIWTCEGAVRLKCQLCRCSNRACSEHRTLVGPEAELQMAMPHWVLGWDVLCWLGHRRFARHWSVPQIRHELADRFGIRLSKDAINEYVGRYQQMVAACQHDPDEFRKAYQGVSALVLSIDGLQPEKGHETLYVVREVGQKRVWFAVSLLASNDAELKKVFERVKQMVEELGLPVRCWLSDKQKAFVNGIKAVFAGVPHRYCDNHFLRELAKPMLEADSHAKVQMRKKVRELRKIEQAVMASQTADAQQAVIASPPVGGLAGDSQATEAASASVVTADVAAVSNVVLDYCVAVRGILNDNRGGPLHPPGERMAEALIEVRDAIRENPEVKKGDPQRPT
jgi:hypothetical protein